MERLDLQVELNEELFRQALDPRAFVEARDLPGGAAPKATAKVLDVQRESIEDDRQWLGGRSWVADRCRTRIARLSQRTYQFLDRLRQPCHS